MYQVIAIIASEIVVGILQSVSPVPTRYKRGVRHRPGASCIPMRCHAALHASHYGLVWLSAMLFLLLNI
jgi:hypothetical protein